MKLLKRILLASGLMRMNAKRMQEWSKEKNIESLEYALKQGLFKTRIAALEGLENIGTVECLALIEKEIDDLVSAVSLKAIKLLEIHKPSSRLIKKMEEKKAYWENEHKIHYEHLMDPEKKSDSVPRWERSSKASFEAVKERLKRPLR